MGGVVHRVALVNAGSRPLALGRVEVCSAGLGAPSVEVFRQGFYMPSDPSGFFVLEAGRKAPPHSQWKPACFDDWRLVSHTMAVWSAQGSKRRALLGFVTGREHESYLVFNTRGKAVRLTVEVWLHGVTLPPGGRFELEPFLVAESADFNTLTETWAQAAARAGGARVPAKTVTGWSDWQFYREEKCEADVMASAKVMAEMRRQGWPLDYVIVDGGWCKHASEWLQPCDKFPSGMKWLSAQMRRMGLKLGVWFAPYITNVKTDVARRRPEWMVMDEKTGKPLERPGSNVGPCRVVDFTVPEAMEWMRGVVRVMVRDWKIGLLKLDGPGLFHYRGGRFHNAGQTPVQMIRRTLEVIRQECGQDVIVEGEGVYGPSIGAVDIQRTTQDNHPFWQDPHSGRPALKENMKNDMLSGFLHGRLWRNHRENIILRDFPSHVVSRRREHPGAPDQLLPNNELLFQLTASAFGGGALLLTDPLPALRRSPERLDLAARLLPHAPDAVCRPFDVFQGGAQPSVYTMAVERPFESWLVVGVFNWSDEHRDFRLPLARLAGPGAWHAVDFWRREYLGRFVGGLDVRDVAPHACRALALRRDLRRPQLAGSDVHLLQGAVEIEAVEWNSGRLTVDVRHFALRRRRLFLAHPASWRLKDIETDAREVMVDIRRGDAAVVEFTARRAARFITRWEKA